MKKFQLLLSVLLINLSTYAQTFPIVGTILKGQEKNVISSGLSDDMAIEIRNTGVASLKFYLSVSATGLPSAGTRTVELPALTVAVGTIAQLGGIAMGTNLNVVNTAGNTVNGTGAFSIDRAGNGIQLGPTDPCNSFTIMDINGNPVGGPAVPAWVSFPGKMYTCYGNIGIGTSTPGYMFDVSGNSRISGNVGIHTAPDGTHALAIGGATKITGNVGIGTAPDASHALAVNGQILAKSIDVRTNWSDFVFEKDYTLMSLADLEQYINQNKHLPEIPAAAEVEDKGADVGDMLKLQMQKIEELTLYVIEQNKKIEVQQKEIDALKKRRK